MPSSLPPTAAVRPRPTAAADPRRPAAAQAGVHPAAQAVQAAQDDQDKRARQTAEARPRARPAAAAAGAHDARRKARPLAVLALQARAQHERLVDAVRPRHPGPWGLSRAPWLGPGAVRVVAPARAAGLGQQVLAAPMDGCIAQATLQPGARVQAGQVLLTLQDQDLQLEQARGAAEVSQLDNKFCEDPTTDDATQNVRAHRRLAQGQAQLDLVLHPLERTRLRAPFDGVLLAGEHTPARGAPVKRGETLLTLAPALRWRIVAEVDEQDIAPVREQQRGQVVLAAGDGPPLPARREHLAPGAPRALPSPALGDAAGGPVALDPADSSGQSACEPHLLVDLRLPAGSVALVGTRARAEFSHGQAPLGQLAWRALRRAFLRHVER